MKSLYTTWIRMMMLLSGIVFTPAVFASVICSLQKSTPSISVTLQLGNINITSGADQPLGTLLYTGRFVQTSPRQILCEASMPSEFSLTRSIQITSAPTITSSWSNNKHQQVFESGVRGVGIAIWRDDVSVTTAKTAIGNYYFADSQTDSYDSSFSFGLIKTAEIASGSIHVNNFPTVNITMGNNYGVTNLPPDIVLATVNFTGIIQVVAQTCNTSDINVDLGKHSANGVFKKIGSVTSWIDASITLTRCPAFRGYYGGDAADSDASKITINNDNVVTNMPARTANGLYVSFQPATNVIDVANGIMALSNSENQTVAKGVGIQIGWGNASGSPELLNFAGRTFTPPSEGTATFKIPIAARYIQTEAVVTPGLANGRAIFIINYH